MKRYFYTVRDEKGKMVKGNMLAESDIELGDKLSNLGYYLTSFKVAKGVKTAKRSEKASNLHPREVLRITFQLATLIDAGLPLLEGLKDLAREAGDDKIQRVMDDIRYRVESGDSLEGALSFHPDSFSQLYRAIIGAGEATGKLAQVLDDLVALLEWQMELQAKMKEAAIYPLILFVVMVGVVVLLVVKVIPMFTPIFEQLGSDLPLPTRIVLGVSYAIRHYWYVIMGAIGALFFAYKTYNATEKGRYNVDGVKLKIPLFGDLLRKVALSRFAHTFALSFRAGINLLTCLDIARKTAGNSRIENAIAKARDSVNVGEKLAVSLKVTGEFPAMVTRMVAIGEQSGSLVKTSSKVAEYYDREVSSTIKKLFTAFEPIMIVVMGVVVGGIALAIFMPMFQMVEMVG
ncbi:MAG: type II secretion system F family protein [Candidatus Omnitrophica bacterium]|nr:type II secretion system F family protein [Candidatus Omnitrophota bacterium]